MRIDIRTKGFTLTDALREQTERRLRFALGGLGSRLGRVGVTLADENGPRGGVDKRCTVRLKLPAQPAIVIEQQDTDLYVAISCAVERAARALTRQLGKLEAQRRDSSWSEALT